MTSKGSAREAMAALRERYRTNSGAIIASFAALAAELRAEPSSPEVIERLRREAHRVRGTAGTYGFTDAGQLAEALERRCELWAREPDADAGHRAAYAERIAAGLATAFATDERDPRDAGSA